MLKQRALFIDRDGTINRDCPYCHEIEDLHIFPKTVDLIRNYMDKNYLIIIVTNQSGIGRGLFTEEEFHRFHNKLVSDLGKKGININKTFYCPHTPEDNCDCRKPKLGMIYRAVNEFDIDLNNSIIIGDRDDMEGEMGRKLGIEYKIINNAD